MSGHNPHSHLSQPNSSWNPLQIPSYIPRQPQLAHTHNERPMVRSPLTWHTPAPPTPPDAFYSFLSANHKSLELNPLLPSFVRGPPPFGSVDLTIQTARNSTTPSPRNLTTPPPTHQDFSAHNKPHQQPPFPPQHLPHHQAHQQPIPRCITPNNLNSCSIPPAPATGVIQSTGSVRDKFQCGTSNGSNNGDLPQAAPAPGSIFIRDARQINSDLAKMTSREHSAMEVAQLHLNEPVELTKENPFQSTLSHAAAPTSPKRLSPTRPPSMPNTTPMSPTPRSPLTTLSNTGSTNDMVNNHLINASANEVQLLNAQKAEENLVTAVASMSSENSPLPLTLPPSPTTTTSNEDSVDSQSSKSRRKRKPNKTTRVSNDSDESMPEQDSETSSVHRAGSPNEQADVNAFEKSGMRVDSDISKAMSSAENEVADMTTSKNTICQSDQGNTEPLVTTAHMQPKEHMPPCDFTEKQLLNEKPDEASPVERDLESPKESSLPEPIPIPDEPHSVIVNNKNPNPVIRDDSKSPVDSNNVTDLMPPCQTKEVLPTTQASLPSGDTDPKPNIPNVVERSPISDTPVQQEAASDESEESPRMRTKRKGESDDIETIDKIAAMIASTQSTDEPSETVMPIEDDLDVLSKEIADHEEKPMEIEPEEPSNKSEPTTSSKISDLTDILGTPSSGSSPDKDVPDTSVTNAELKPTEEVKANIVENCFEEVENKLEEMFAGIEDGEPPPCILPAPTLDEPITPEVISELGLGGITSPQKQIPREPSPTMEDIATKSTQEKDENSSKSSSSHQNSSQKRSHNNSTKVESTPPNKKRKMSKKSASASNQKPSTSASTKSAKSQLSSASTSSSSKPSKSSEKLASSASTTKDTKIKEEPATVEYKGPFIHLKSDGTISVINAPTTEDVVEKQNKVKKSIHSHSHSDRGKIRGLHVSTLSTKYDADTTDTTWMCVFCKRGPHKVGLGDLFGPYIITTTCEGFAYSQKDPSDDEFVSKRTKADMFVKHVNGMPIVPAATSSLALATLNASSSSPSTSKKKRKNNDSPGIVRIPTPSSSSSPFDINDIYIGMTQVSETSYEVWVHEDCVVWSSGVHIIGSRIVGLDTAVWSSTRYKCSICSNNGAMISCLQRCCPEKAHLSCARVDNWNLDESEFKSTCSKHAIDISS